MTTYTTYPPPASGTTAAAASHGFESSHLAHAHVHSSPLNSVSHGDYSSGRQPVLPPLQTGGYSKTFFKQPQPNSLSKPRSAVTPDTGIGNNSASLSGLSQSQSHHSVGSSHNYGPIASSYSSTPGSVSFTPLPSHTGAFSAPPVPQLGSSMFNASTHPRQLTAYPGLGAAGMQPEQQHQLPPPLYPDAKTVAVVGSQGRRGLLPSVGRLGTGAEQSLRGGVVPIKDNTGKFICTSCNKTYLHLKHLKRHHLRHTGERPYQCYLCHETFCRSDILKRHFQKCSVRRGNPTGATHLTHAQAHLKGNNNGRNGSSNSPPSGHAAMPYRQYMPVPSSGTPSNPAMASTGSGDDSNDSSRSSSVMRPESSGSEERRYQVSQGMQPPRTSSADAAPLPPPAFAMDQHDTSNYHPAGDLGGQERFGSYSRAESGATHGQSYFGHLDGDGSQTYFAQNQGHTHGVHFGRASPNFNSYHHASVGATGQASWSMNSMFTPQNNDSLMQGYAS